ncbi:hypothetical protein FAZ19_20170 [Sphingobacterium alkalisoli]|uniref:Uncharacterized protein n=1 Tax=Sphingobacterium alkalisoli TaxID=1874115 RepID=A0A4U0GX37_9SPHI|nr:hypothetical protein [Sphingobacterium alkalisoli]TJY62382.1 hypothetical protein FAZ19_20170 [Sphingobacterium alkalisoli]GGH29796.1 hypothetical protein GCM10011418_41390 [Sphingobacterium alkalisoli]
MFSTRFARFCSPKAKCFRSFGIGTILLSSSFVLSSCIKRLYQQSDYRLYEKDFTLSSQSLLRTDGVYVLDSIYSSETSRAGTTHQFFTFFKSGQANLTLDIDNDIHSPEEYEESVRRHLQSTSSSDRKTLFEGYFRIDGNRIVIERASVPRNMLVYQYGRLNPNRLEIVSQTIKGKGRLRDRYFKSNYRAVYKFVPLDENQWNELIPGW